MAAIVIPAGDVSLHGDLNVPPGATGIVVIVDDGRRGVQHSPHRRLARRLRSLGFATLLVDLADDGHGDVPHMAECLRLVTEWLARGPESWQLRPGYMGTSRAAGAALVAAAALGGRVGAVVSQDGRADLAGADLQRVAAPTLLLVDEEDDDAMELNREAFDWLRCDRHLQATRGDDGPEAADENSRLVTDWFRRYLC
ncbi:MAG TPA: hypothetical protein VGR62_04260 [Candidatus Binatia bacterium]|jgi:dienelactone hydrolase|nr:hypothetical protein [Candidatus Binatia bacterium]